MKVSVHTPVVHSRPRTGSYHAVAVDYESFATNHMSDKAFSIFFILDTFLFIGKRSRSRVLSTQLEVRANSKRSKLSNVKQSC